MTSRFLYIILILAYCNFCCNSNSPNKDNSIQDKEKDFESFKKVDSLTILYKPSFINYCTLRINRNKDSAILEIDSIPGLVRPPFNNLKKFSVLLQEMELNTSIKNFYDTNFLKKLSFDSTRMPMLDGISFRVYYFRGFQQDSLYTGNNLPEGLQIHFKKLIQFLNKKSHDPLLKQYLNNLSEYMEF